MKPAHIFSVGVLLAAGWLFAQSPQSATAPNPAQSDATPQPGDPPTRVARLNWLAGDVSFQPAGLEDWTDATINYPLTTSDHLVTGKDSRAELHIGSNAIRLDADSNFGFLNLDDTIVQVSLTQGSMEIHLSRLDDDDAFEIATPNGAITLLRTGDYRIDTDPDRDATMLTVRAGQADLLAGNNSVLIRAQQTAYFHESQDADVRTANPKDDFDTFVSSREGNVSLPNSEPVAASYAPPAPVVGNPVLADTKPVSDEVTGAEDLNSYGSWQNVPVYGDVWVPPVDADWAPYSKGNWAYVDPWGWTWIDAAPWGFAPFHYGRWAFVRNHWVWVPGGHGDPIIYAPALVTFCGGGATGIISWYPLGPRDAWIPPWRTNPVTPVIIPNSPALRRGFPIMADRDAPGAIRTMSQIDFVGGNHVSSGVALSPEGQVLGSQPLLAPSQRSVLIGTTRPRPIVASRPLIARTAPPPAPILFSVKQSLLAKNHGRPLPAAQLADLRQKAPYAIAQSPIVRSSRPLVVAPARVAKPVAAKPAPRPNAGQARQ
jgi:hypothetical protein